MKINKLMSLRTSAFIAGVLSLFAIADLSAHGYVSSPQSRVLVCYNNGIENPVLPACIAAKAANANQYGFYSPQEITNYEAMDNHQQLLPDGTLCSANRSIYAGLDLARNDWQANVVAPGPREFVWTNTAMHRTKYFRYYITKNGFNPGAAPLKWSDLELIHESTPAGLEATSTHQVNLPQRSGKHIVFAVWQRDWQTDAPEANYQCIDVDFQPLPRSSSSSSSSSVVDQCNQLPFWNSSSVYVGGQQVKHNNKRYQANYWTQGNNPEQSSGQYNHWLDLGSCNASSSSSSLTSSNRSSSISSRASSSSRSSNSSSPYLGCRSPVYSNSFSYANGDLVQNFGYEYRCEVSGWCNIGGPYVPGVGWAWQQAWTRVRSCAIE